MTMDSDKSERIERIDNCIDRLYAVFSALHRASNGSRRLESVADVGMETLNELSVEFKEFRESSESKESNAEPNEH